MYKDIEYEKWFPQRLTQLRAQKGVSARDMSLSIGQNTGYINSIENGKNFPTMKNFFYICEYLHITPQEFFEDGNADPETIRGLVENLKKLDGEQVVLDDGRFELLLVPNPKNAAELQNLIWALLNQQYDAGGLIFRHVTALHVETDEDLPWSLDGEYAPSRPAVDITNRQRALTMLL